MRQAINIASFISVDSARRSVRRETYPSGFEPTQQVNGKER